MSYNKNSLSLALLIVSNISLAMDLGQQPMNAAQDYASSVSRKLVTPELLFRKPWVRRVLMCVSMIANFCRYCEAEDEYEVNPPEPSPLQSQPIFASVFQAPSATSEPKPQSKPVVKTPSSTQGIGAQPQPQSFSAFAVNTPPSVHQPKSNAESRFSYSNSSSSSSASTTNSSSVKPSSFVKTTEDRTGERANKKPCDMLDEASIKKYYGRDRQMLEDTFANTKEAKNLVHLLNNQPLYMIESRIRLLYGEPGVGKSTLARAIAYKAGWHITCICGRQIRGEHRGSTSIRLQQKLQEIVAKGENTIIIIDEMNRLFEEYNNSNFDTGDTAEDFWTFLDDQQDNQQLYILGTMNNVDKFPPQLQSRARGSWIKLEKPKELTGTVQLFKRMCTGGPCVIDPSCTDQKLMAFLTPLHGKWTPRDYKILICRAVEIARETNPLAMPIPITKAHLEAAKAKTDESDTDTKYGTKHETRDEKEERRHKANKKLQKDHHTANLVQQKTLHDETQKMQKEHFARNAMIQKDMQTNQKSESYSGGFNAVIVNGSYTSSSNNTGVTDATIANNLPTDEKEIYRKLRREQLQPLIDTVRQRIADLTIAIQDIDRTYPEETRKYDAAIQNAPIAAHTAAHAIFDALSAPSLTEITTMRDALKDIDKEAAELIKSIQYWIQNKPRIDAYFQYPWYLRLFMHPCFFSNKGT